MKLDRSILGLALVAVSVVCGCSSSVSAPAAPRSASNEASTTQLTSADALVAPRAPKVGKVQLVADEDLGGGSVDTTDELVAPKEPRRATTHHRGGGFGVTK